LSIAIVFYSRTGVTEMVIGIIAEKLREQGFKVDVFEARPRREYGRPLHLNPRLLYDTFTGRLIDIVVKPSKPTLDDHSLVILASPIWCGKVSPPIRAFIRAFKCPGKTAVCLTTSQIERSYSARLRAVAEAEGGFKVIYDGNLVKGKLDEQMLNEILEAVKKGAVDMTVHGPF